MEHVRACALNGWDGDTVVTGQEISGIQGELDLKIVGSEGVLVWDFMKDLEDAWYDQKGSYTDAQHADADDVEEREAIGGVLTQKYVLPEDLPSVTYQVHKKGGKPVVIHLETENIVTDDGIDASWAKQYGTTLDKIIDVLAKGGAKLRKKRKPRKYTPPMYD